MRLIIIIIALVLIGVGAFYAFNSYIYNEKQADPTQNLEAQTMNKKSPIIPITHASLILNVGDTVIYNDPTGDASLYANYDSPSIILVSDIHGDHMDPETLKAVSTQDTTIIVPQAVADELPEGIPGTIKVMKNGDKETVNGISIEAIPMYNVPEAEDSRHTKGRGNGYILEANGQRIYLAGDTANTPEMRALQNIDTAFVPMNLPFTMGVEEAAQAVLAFKPKTVIPYHYRGQDGLADTNKFKELVNTGNPEINVELLNFYPGE